MSDTDPHIFCWYCGYPLDDSNGRGSCPECGRHYDPERPNTFRTTPIGQIEKFWHNNYRLVWAGICFVTGFSGVVDAVEEGFKLIHLIIGIIFILASGYCVLSHFRSTWRY